MAKVSVIIPTWNNAPFLGETLRSTLGQSFTDFEVIIIDSASSDGTPDLISAFKDTRIRHVELPDVRSEPLQRNVGLRLATGTYCAIMDADDIMDSTRLETQGSFLDQHPEVDIVGSDFTAFGDGWSEFRTQPASDAQIKARLLLVNGSGIHNPTVMLRRRCLIENDLYYPMMKVDADHALWGSDAGECRILR